MHELVFNNSTNSDLDQFEQLYREIFTAAEKVLNISKSLFFSINFIDEVEAKKMNVFYRNKDYIPDVLSFNVDTSYNQEYELTSEEEELGDIFICFEEAQRKSVRYKHTIKQEMAFLFVHGFLHLMGYDHEAGEDEEKEMFNLQDLILNEVGIEYKITFDEQDYLRG